MATKKNFLNFGVDKKVNPTDTGYELDESDVVWNSISTDQHASTEPKRSIFGSRTPKRSTKKHDHAAAKSMPIDVVDWSKIIRDEYVDRRSKNDDYDDDDVKDGGEDERLPPHEYLARKRGASFSVQEGIGRTLKGRDMCRVRNAIWKRTGFELD